MAKNEIILCDTNIIIELLRGNLDIKTRLQQIGAANIALSIITHAEIYFGAKKSEFSETRNILESFKVCHLSQDVSKVFNGIMLNYSLSHRPKIPDALIAACSIVHNYRLYTENKKDFDFIPEIRFYDPKV